MKGFYWASLFVFSLLSHQVNAQLTEPEPKNIKLVSTTIANKLIFFPQRSAPAKVVPLNHSVIPSQISALVTNIPVNVGDKVKQGEVLTNLDCRNYQLIKRMENAQVNLLKNQLAFDQREVKRGKTLAKNKNIGDADLDRRETQLLNTQAQLIAQQAALNLAKLNEQRCEIKAPFDGVITERIASIGNMIDVGKPVIKMLEDNNMQVSALITSADMVSFKQAATYSFINNTISYSLSISSIVPLINENARSQEARFNFTSSFPIAGSSGRVIWQSPMPFLPAHLLVLRNKQYGYFIMHNNKAKFIAVEDAEEGRPIPFHIADESLIIVEGRHGLNDGDKIRVIDIAEPSIAELKSLQGLN